MANSDVILISIELVLAVLLYLLADYADKVLSAKWKLCYVLPLLVGLVFSGIYGTDACLLGVYLGAVLMLAGFVWEIKRVRHITAALSGLLILSAVPVVFLSPGYRAPDYAAEFQKGFETMREYYVLGEHKGIDWEALYEEYLPRFQEAREKHDKVENYMLWNSFCGEFHDGHVHYMANDEDTEKKAWERMYGNDYGLALMSLDNGKTVAVNVEPQSVPAQAGIHNGTVITAWNGQDIEALKLQMDRTVYDFPDKENEAFYSALLVAGRREEQASITYLDEEGRQQTVEAPRRGYYWERLESTMDTLHQGIAASNLAWVELDEDTWCLRLKGMMYDSESYNKGNHRQMQQELREKLLQLKEEGVDRLVIDLRSNGGGSPQFIMAIAELFAPEGTHTYVYDGVWDEDKKRFLTDEATGKYVVGNSLSYQGENLWEEGEIILLVNALTVSAGDHFIWLMNGFENVTIMGFTKSNGSAQAVRGVNFEEGSLTFSTVPALCEDGSFFIDSDASRVSRMPLTVKIPFDEQAVEALFDRGEDYLLNRALEYLEEK
ncbi:MAG: S41 family peptidase [Roseburia sp.]|nr:S41 family peptidase [Roseburia sp.]